MVFPIDMTMMQGDDDNQTSGIPIFHINKEYPKVKEVSSFSSMIIFE
jgi:hypothetical protein